MSKQIWSVVVIAWALSLAAVAALAQSRAVPSDAVILSGNDIGFRVESYQGKRPIGTLVVRVDGRWVEPKSLPQPTPLGSR